MASTWHSGLLIVVLVFGILFAMLYFSSEASPKVVTIIIPEGSALESSENNGFQPKDVLVVIGMNNTVRWVNQGNIPSTIVPDDSSDSDFVLSAERKRASDNPFVKPNESFEYTFTKHGIFGYHSEPQPWKRGSIIVEDAWE